MKERHEVDTWTRLLNQRAREYVAQGMSAEDAEERAAADVRREIRKSNIAMSFGTTSCRVEPNGGQTHGVARLGQTAGPARAISDT